MKILLMFIISLVFIGGCSTDMASSAEEKTTGRRTAKETLYYNSFESDSDTTGCMGITPGMFINGAAPGCGSRSLYIGGGCIQPAGSIKIKVKEAGSYNISLWEKTPDTGGVLNFIIDNDENQVVKDIPLNSKEWKHHLIENVYLPGNCTLTINLIVGGLIYASANIDELSIQKADQ